MQLHHRKAVLYFGAALTGFFLLIVCVALVAGRLSQQSLLFSGMMSPFLLGSAPILLAYFRNRHELTASGMIFGSTFGKRGQFHWADVCKVKYDSDRKRVRIEARTGEVAHVPIMLVGTPQFAHIVLHNVPPEAIDPTARKALKWLVLGEVPPL
jgi:hypothetical protein